MPKAKKEKAEEIDWDKKKIFIFTAFAILLIVLFLNFKSMILGESESPKQKTPNYTSVKGISTEDLSNNIKEGVGDNINNLKAEAQNLDIVEIASSSPQVQKIINDLKSLKDLPKNELKNACENICGKL
jgi:hypothetical protein